MSKAANPTLSTRLSLAGALITLFLASFGFATARAATPPGWQIASISNTAVKPGEELTYAIEVINRTDDYNDGTPLTVTLALPQGLTGVSFTEVPSSPAGFSCGNPAGLSVIKCETSTFSSPDIGKLRFYLTAAVDPGAAPGIRVATATVSGSGLAADSTVDPVRITDEEPAFGIDTFDVQIEAGDGSASSEAGAHPSSLFNAIDFNLHTDTSPTPRFDEPRIIGPNEPVEPLKDTIVELPPGLLGNPSGLAQCTSGQLANTEAILPRPLCPPESQLGAAEFRLNGVLFGDTFGPYPVFNMVPPPGVPARFGVNVLGTLVTLDASVRADSDYGVTVTARNASAGIPVGGAHFEFWGVPADPAHEPKRACPGERGPDDSNGVAAVVCPSSLAPSAFLRNPTACSSSALSFGARASSWFHPADFVPASAQNHEAPGYPYPAGPATFPAGYSGPESQGSPVGTDACDQVPFEPSFSATPTSQSADSPTGLSLEIGLPSECWEEKATAAEAEAAICQSDLKESVITLPQGLAINPSAASGRDACTPTQIGLRTPVGTTPAHFNELAAACPEASKLGTVEITTPLLDQPLKGAIYLAQQAQNPFGSLLAIYLVAEGSGVVVKQAGEIATDPATGRITTSFTEVPQLPFASVQVDLFGGPRAALRTPSACGTHSAQATLTPWSGTGAVDLVSSFEITQGCGGGFDPKLSAGTQNPLAGSFSPFSLRLSRADGTEELAGLRLAVPKGLVASLKGIPYCSDATLNAISGEIGTGNAQITSPSCPAASQVGTVTAGAGVGPNPFYSTTGRAYWAGPYKGAPVSLAAVVPAVAGPFDLGNVVVRNGFEVDPETAQITAVSDPFPTILHGIPLDLRDVRLNLNRPDYTLNPTSCEPLSFEADIASVTGAHAQRSQHFQAAACDRLRFKPKLSLKLSGPTNRGAHPALRAVLRMPKGGANIGRVSVALPGTELLENAHIGTVCTRVQFAAGAGGGAECPPRSVYGHVRVTSPLVDYPLSGPVILRSSSHKLPDLVAVVRGVYSQPIVVATAARIDTARGGRLRTSFESFPDVPISKAVLTMQGRKKGLLVNSTDICRAKPHATASFEGQNGKLSELHPLLEADCGGKRESR